MGKYLLTKNGLDDYTLSYGEKKIDFHSCVEIVTKLQRINELAKKKMILDLAEQGKTVNDLIKKKVVNGKNIEDYTNYNAYLKVCNDEVSTDLFNEGVEKMLGISLAKLLIEIGIQDNTEEALKLSEELGKAMTGGFPEKGQEKVDQ